MENNEIVLPISKELTEEKIISDKNLMELIHEYKESPGNQNDPSTVFSKLELVTHNIQFTIPTGACIYYENKIFTFESLEQNENGKYDSQKFKDKATYFDNRVNNTFREISICDAKKALFDFTTKNNFTVIFGSRACCNGYRITKLGFEFTNDNLFIEQESCWGCDNYVDTMDSHNYPINENTEILHLMLSTALQHLKNKRKDHCISAASKGKIEWLKYAHQKGYQWDSWTCACAAGGGHIDCLKYARENGCEWNEKTTESAASRGNIECLKYAIENGCPIGEEITRWTAEGGSLECLKYLHEYGHPFHEMTTFAAAQHGRLECLKYAIENGAPKHPETCRMARGNCQGDACYNYARENGCPE
jgi:hypothetical protein